ncbi:BhlA/UviB family holin-like peptide [Tuberibacillus calidus]|jgi:Mg2+ and Co2+ transporter CorA|uniref:BhlA/UviB family holin-like peptide n=1 Tax=Tuberibacillus calidus TaxID=340097 RepID=UPI0003FFECFD|nr:BhlA/UviB family holin-like peptide [Tuberibacillus calidus]
MDIVQLITEYGIIPSLFIYLFFFTIKNNKEREERLIQESKEREERLYELIDNMTEKYDTLSGKIDDLKESIEKKEKE